MVSNLLDAMLGPDHLEFEQTPDTKYCVVAPQSVPRYEYDHQRWENELALQLTKNFETPEPPSKIPRVSTKLPVKRVLSMQPGSAARKSSSVNTFVPLTSYDTIRVPRVPAWGGTFGTIKLVNTCPIDNFLTIFYTQLKNVPHFSAKLSEMSEPWAKRLVAIAQIFDNGEFTGGKVEWLSPFSQFDFSVAHSTIDVWGNEFDLFWQQCNSMLKTEFKSICSSEHCPNQDCTVTATGINLTEASCLQTGETYLESTLREWLMPAPGQCGKHFIGTPPVSAEAILGPQCLDVTSGQNYQP